ncbi:MAG TPA: TMEM175 family protein [Bacteroidia bacterium]|nr:TMEM175 family protein [Bacteroidia bacterium]
MQNETASKETSRLEAFSDGVFAIAITLLILELIQVLKTDDGSGLTKLLFHHWHSMLAYLIGFLTILICWINHHLVFNYIQKSDSLLMWINGLVLFVVTFTPFPTAILAEYLEKDSHTAVFIYGCNYLLMSIAAYGISAYTYHKHFIPESKRKEYYAFVKLYKYSIIFTFLNLIVCMISVPVSLGLYFILFIVFAFPREFSVWLIRAKNK